MNELEIGWLAGLLEGEGYFAYGKVTQIVTLEMCDDDIVNKAAILIAKITGNVPEVSCRKRKEKNRNYTYQFTLTGRNARATMKSLVRYMGYRRRAQIWQALNGYKTKKHEIDLLEMLGISHESN